jgi:Fe-S cluster assembly ATPase SufC
MFNTVTTELNIIETRYNKIIERYPIGRLALIQQNPVEIDGIELREYIIVEVKSVRVNNIGGVCVFCDRKGMVYFNLYAGLFFYNQGKLRSTSNSTILRNFYCLLSKVVNKDPSVQLVTFET